MQTAPNLSPRSIISWLEEVGRSPSIGRFDRRARAFELEPWADLLRRSLRLAAPLHERDVRGRPVLVVAGGSPLDAVVGFFAAIDAGGLPVVAPARPAFDDAERSAGRFEAIATSLGDPLALVVGSSPSDALGDLDLVVADPDGTGAPADEGVEPDLEAPAYLQLTSGSTQGARVVAVSHRAIRANSAATARVADLDPDDAILGWLPLYHDMGLIGMVLMPAMTGHTSYVMTPFDFLSRPGEWLEQLSQTGAAMTYGPNFAYELVLRRAKLDDASLRLDRLKLMACGAEPVDPATMREFTERFRAAGLPSHCPSAGYGLAENTLSVASAGRAAPTRRLVAPMTDLRGLRSVPTDRFGSVLDGALAEGEVELASSGPLVEGVTVTILDEDDRPVTEDGVFGEIAVAGESLALGYRRPDGSIDRFDPDVGVRTGDIGCWCRGELVPVERSKRVIIRNGVNYATAHVERRIAAELGISSDDVAVFDSDLRPGVGLVTAVIETRAKDTAEQLVDRAASLAAELEPAVEHVLVVRSGRLARTTSGKKRHSEIRQSLADDALDPLAERRPIIDLRDEPARPAWGTSTIGMIDVIQSAAEHHGVTRPIRMEDQLVADLGLDSLAVFELVLDAEAAIGVRVPEQRLREVRTVRDLVEAATVDVLTPRLGERIDAAKQEIPQLQLVADDQDGRRVLIDGRWRIDFASCNYLGLDLHPEVMSSIPALVDRWGTHPSWTRAVASPRPYRDLEEALARTVGVDDVVVFPTITLLHQGVLPILAGRGGVMIVDQAAHQSLQEAARLAEAGGAVLRSVPHDDLAAYEATLAANAGAHRRVIVIDGVYSMSGRRTRLPEIVELAERYDATVYVDDAHGFGILGTPDPAASKWGLGGGGLLRHTGISTDRVVYVAGLSKAFSSMGAFVTVTGPLSRRRIVDASTLIFGGPVPVASLATALAGLEVNRREGDELRDRLHRLTQRLLDGVADIGLGTKGDDFPIVNVVVGPLDDVVKAAKRLWERDLVITPAMFPAMPLDEGGIRLTVTAANTEVEIDQAIDALASLNVPVLR
ncbi:MAG: aminotransferase class I/II-fold pyridoxal phosphate-dependent enzyme [Actinomycetota bacterium]